MFCIIKLYWMNSPTMYKKSSSSNIKSNYKCKYYKKRNEKRKKTSERKRIACAMCKVKRFLVWAIYRTFLPESVTTANNSHVLFFGFCFSFALDFNAAIFLFLFFFLFFVVRSFWSFISLSFDCFFLPLFTCFSIHVPQFCHYAWE